MNKLTDEQIKKITEDILVETFPNGSENEENILYPIAETALLMISKFMKKYQEEIDK